MSVAFPSHTHLLFVATDVWPGLLRLNLLFSLALTVCGL